MNQDRPKGKTIFEGLIKLKTKQAQRNKRKYHWTIIYAEVIYDLIHLSTTPNQAQAQYKHALQYGKDYYEGKYDNLY